MKHRTYLWLYLAMDDIRITVQYSFRPNEESIEIIPQSVHVAYKRILDRVPADKIADVKMILQIIVGARRPLTIQEMAMALGVAMSSSSRMAAWAGLNPEGLANKIRHLCRLFVFISDLKIYLIHETAREFLIKNGHTNGSNSKWCFEPTDTENLMSRISLRYLSMDDLEKISCNISPRFKVSWGMQPSIGLIMFERCLHRQSPNFRKN